MRINTGIIPSAAPKPVAYRGPAPVDRCWRYSLRHWRQLEDFGVGSVDAGWFISLLDRLKQLSAEPLSRFSEDTKFQDDMRYHEIDWEWPNIPIQRSDLNWLPKDIQDNPAEYPIFQIQISTALGRILGFWDSDWVFNILLLDPKHNAQPSRYSEYQVRATTVGECKYSSLWHRIETIRSEVCEDANCGARQALNELSDELHDHHRVIVAVLDDAEADKAKSLIKSGKAKSLSEILAYGVVAYGDHA